MNAYYITSAYNQKLTEIISYLECIKWQLNNGMFPDFTKELEILTIKKDK